MKNPLKKTWEINAPVSKVWRALTDSGMIKKYFFGTEATSDWRKGSTIFYRGVWEGKPYEDKGIILELIPEKLLTVNYWSNRSGKPDIPANYSPYSYELNARGDTTLLTLSQENTYTAETEKNAWQHWDIVMAGLKELVEN